MLFWIILTPLNRIGKISFNNYDTPPTPGEAITFQEMNAFLEVWSKYLQKDIGKYGLQQISLVVGKPSEKFPPQLVRWLDQEGWNVDRFFYLEQRLKAIVKTALLMEHLEANRQIYTQMSGRGGDSAALENMRRILQEQEHNLNAEKISPQELGLVKDNLYKINAVLEGNAIYSPK